MIGGMVRILGYILLFGAVFCLLILLYLKMVGLDITQPLVLTWQMVHQPSLSLYEKLIHDDLGLQSLWQSLIAPLLMLPAWIILSLKAIFLGFFAAICLKISNKRKRRMIRPI